MKKPILIIIIIVILVVAFIIALPIVRPDLFRWAEKPPEEQPPEGQPPEQSKGLSFEDAIVIQADNTDDGIDMEYDWLALNACQDKGGVIDRPFQELQDYEGHTFDILHVICGNEEEETYYFQIDSFFGKW